MTKRQLAEAEYLDWLGIAAAWAEAHDRTKSAKSKAQRDLAKAHAETARERMATS